MFQLFSVIAENDNRIASLYMISPPQTRTIQLAVVVVWILSVVYWKYLKGNGRGENMDKLDLILQKMDSLDTKVTAMQDDMTASKTDVSVLKTNMAGLKTNASALQTGMTKLLSDAAQLQSKAVNTKEELIHLRIDLDSARQNLEGKIQFIDLRIGDELIPGIHIVADGHFDLHKKLDHALENEIFHEKIRLHLLHLENQLNLLKQQQAATA